MRRRARVGAGVTDRSWYIAAINRVVDHIDPHLAEALDLETLAGVAHFSPWHFHRLFQPLTGAGFAPGHASTGCNCARFIKRTARRIKQP